MSDHLPNDHPARCMDVGDLPTFEQLALVPAADLEGGMLTEAGVVLASVSHQGRSVVTLAHGGGLAHFGLPSDEGVAVYGRLCPAFRSAMDLNHLPAIVNMSASDDAACAAYLAGKTTELHAITDYVTDDQKRAIESAEDVGRAVLANGGDMDEAIRRGTAMLREAL